MRPVRYVLPPLLVGVMAALAAGCASEEDPRRFPPAAAAVPSPPLTEKPDGRVVTGAAGRALRLRLDFTPATAVPGGRAASVARRERALDVLDRRSGRRLERAPAGVGPTNVAVSGGRAFVADTDGRAVLVFALEPELDPIFRVALTGAPYGLAADRRRGELWVTATATNRVLVFDTGARPRFRRSYATVRQPDAVVVDEVSGRAFIAGPAEDEVQVIEPGEG